MLRTLGALAIRIVLIAVVAVVAALVPLPVWAPPVVVYVQVPLVTFIAICCMGKILIDTLFYPRYP